VKLVGVLLLLLCWPALAQPVAAPQAMYNLPFAQDGERELLLDVYLPEPGEVAPPLLVWLHGGDWRGGDKDGAPRTLAGGRYALASVGFRSSTDASFPAQIHDIKAAIRYLRANAWRYGYDADRIALWGYSSGGHLALLAGLSAQDPVFEGQLGTHTDTSSAVQAVIAIAAPTDLLTLLEQTTRGHYDHQREVLAVLLGRDVVDPDPELVQQLRLASPVSHVGKLSPPVILIHGLQDLQVPASQPLELQQAYEQAGLQLEAYWLPEADHFSGEFFSPQYSRLIHEFLDRVFLRK
jgi:acetyl esterase/lipase